MLTLAQAEKMAEAACRKAEELGIRVSAAIVDASGHLIVLKRMDGAPSYTAFIAASMAYTSALFQQPGEELVSKYNQPWFHGLVLQSGGRVLPSQGGLLIRDLKTGAVLGATGISGGTGEQDKVCAQAALDAFARS